MILNVELTDEVLLHISADMLSARLHIGSSVQDFSNSIANALESLQSCTELFIYPT